MSKKNTVDLVYIEEIQEPVLDNNLIPSTKVVKETVRNINKDFRVMNVFPSTRNRSQILHVKLNPKA